MLDFPDYKLLSLIHENSRNLIYKAERNSDLLPVVIKIFTDTRVDRIMNEYQIARDAHLIDGIIRVYELVQNDNSYAIIMEDIDGKSLSSLIKNGLSVKDFLPVAIDLSMSLEAFHNLNFIHKDIKPSNIIVNQAAKEFRIIDFSISTRLKRENQAVVNPDLIEGTLSFISPEQTGRMNRSIDYRTDLYSLGVTFYQMLTGRLPFESSDSTELIHNHIAVKPPGLQEVKKDIPPVLSEIVQKLLAKNPEERYQSGDGLAYDLKQCRKNLEKTGIIPAFPIAKRDINRTFSITGKLYGRKKEIDLLESIYQKILLGSKEMLLVAGKAGIGKSVLISRIQQIIAEKRTFFIGGKFDQFEKNIPYLGIIQAFNALSKQLLAEKKEDLERWKEKILKRVGANGKVICDVIPGIEYIIGVQPAVEELPPAESQNRFKLVFQEFIKAFTEDEHSLILYLDNLQWSDNASLNLLEVLLEDPELSHFLLAGSYRDNEVDSSHQLSVFLTYLQNEGLHWHSIELGPLEISHIEALLTDTLYRKGKAVKELAGLIKRKTNGNPFFMKEFLKNLAARKLITFDRKWVWDIEEINKTGITGNVITLMTGQLKNFPEKELDLLKIASCIGNSFSVDFFACMCFKTPDELLADLVHILDEGILLLIDNRLTFAHDRIEEAVYSLLTEEEGAQYHYMIGKRVLSKCDAPALHEKVFLIAEQLNKAKELLSEQENQTLLDINLKAGIRAKSSNAYDLGLTYLDSAMDLLPRDSWESSYEVTFRLFKEKAECLYLSGDFAGAKKLLALVLEKDLPLIHKLEISIIRIQLYESEGFFDSAIKSAVDALKLLDIEINGGKGGKKSKKNEPDPDVLDMVSKKSSDVLFKLEETKDEHILAAKRLLTFILSDSFMTGRTGLFLEANNKLLSLLLEYGNSVFSSLACGFSALVFIREYGDYKKALKMGDLSLKFARKYGLQLTNCTVQFIYTCFVRHWSRPLKEAGKYYFQAIRHGAASGNQVFLSYCYIQLSNNGIILGKNLEALYDEVEGYLEVLKRLKNISVYRLVQASALRSIMELRGDLSSLSQPCPGCVKENSDKTCEEAFKELPLFAAHLRVGKMRSLYLFSDYKKALAVARESEELVRSALAGMSLETEFYFYYALILAQAAPKSKSGREKKNLLAKIESISKRMKSWADGCAENFLHKYLLIEAEKNRVTANGEAAMTLYEQAILEAKKGNYCNIEALAQELAGRFYAGKKMDKIASLYLTEALFCYTRWGARAKADEVKKEFSSLLKLTEFQSGAGREKEETSSLLDIKSVIKSSQVLSETLLINELLSELTRITIQTSGAQRGIFVLKEGSEWIIESDYDIEMELQLKNKLTDAAAFLAGDISYDYADAFFLDVEDQFTHEIFNIPIPVMKIGGQKAYNNNGITDAISEKIGLDVTLFQVVPEGLLRISTTIKKSDKTRAVGTLIPDNSPVFKAVTSGKIYTGKAFVVNEVSLTGYAPMYDEENNITGVVYVGKKLQSVSLDYADENQFPVSIIHYAIRTQETLIVNDSLPDKQFTNSKYIKRHLPRSFMCIPLLFRGELMSVLYLENRQTANIFSDERIKIVKLLSTQGAISIRNARFIESQVSLTKAYKRFVPNELLEVLEKESIVDLQFGDHAIKEMTILFSDIRNFTTLSENMKPKENFNFLNSYLSRMAPRIKQAGGFIDKYIGDAIMALFRGSAEEGVNAGIAMLQELKLYNKHRKKIGYDPIQIGIGLNTGSVMLGTIGGMNRMDGTVIGDAVNLASRVEGLTKVYGTPLLITFYTFSQIKHKENYFIRFIDIVQVKGKSKKVPVFEVFNGDSEEILAKKLRTRKKFEQAVEAFLHNNLDDAVSLFEKCLQDFPEDNVAAIYLERAVMKQLNI